MLVDSSLTALSTHRKTCLIQTLPKQKKIKTHPNHLGLSLHCSNSHQLWFELIKTSFRVPELDVKIMMPDHPLTPLLLHTSPVSDVFCITWSQSPGQSCCKSLWSAVKSHSHCKSTLRYCKRCHQTSLSRSQRLSVKSCCGCVHLDAARLSCWWRKYQHLLVLPGRIVSSAGH